MARVGVVVGVLLEFQVLVFQVLGQRVFVRIRELVVVGVLVLMVLELVPIVLALHDTEDHSKVTHYFWFLKRVEVE